jgi:hypothetical protein
VVRLWGSDRWIKDYVTTFSSGRDNEEGTVLQNRDTGTRKRNAGNIFPAALMDRFFPERMWRGYIRKSMNN